MRYTAKVAIEGISDALTLTFQDGRLGGDELAVELAKMRLERNRVFDETSSIPAPAGLGNEVEFAMLCAQAFDSVIAIRPPVTILPDDYP